MSKIKLLDRLTAAKRQVDRSDVIVDAQKRIIAHLRACGEDADAAERLLEAFEQKQQFRLGKVDRLLDALDNLPPAKRA